MLSASADIFLIFSVLCCWCVVLQK